MNLDDLIKRVCESPCQHKFHDRALSDNHYLMLIINEFSKVIEADSEERRVDPFLLRKWQKNDFSFSNEAEVRIFEEIFESFIANTVEDICACTFICLLDFARLRDANFEGWNEVMEEIISDIKPNAIDIYSFPELIFNFCKCATYGDVENKILILLCNIMVICHVYSIDIEWYVKQRMRYNECKTNQ